MKMPKMVLFDYGQTLIAEKFDGLKGTEAVLQYATRNKYHLSAEQVQAKADEVWYIGDQYECDVKGSLNAGLLPIWYIGAIDLPYTMKEKHSVDKSILTVKTWSELKQYMEG